MAANLASRLLKSGRNKAAKLLGRNQNDNGPIDFDEYYYDPERFQPPAGTTTEMTTGAAAAAAASRAHRQGPSKGSSPPASQDPLSSSSSSSPSSPSSSTDAGLVHYYVCMPAGGGLEPLTEEQAATHAARWRRDGPNETNNNSNNARRLGRPIEVGIDLDGDDDNDDAAGSHHQRNIFAELMHFNRNRNWKKKVLTVFIIVVSALVLYDLVFLGHIRSWIEAALNWMTLNPVGAVFSIILFFVVATLLFVPPAILMFGAGYAFCHMNGDFWYGFLTSSLVSFVGCVLGAIAAFLRSRYMMRDLIVLFSKRYPIVRALDRALERKGFRVMLLLRLCPIIPFNGLNHIGGVMNVSLEAYTAALVGVIPTILLWCFCGASADRAMRVRVQEDGPQYMYAIIVFSSGLAFGLIAAVLIWRFAIQELRKEIDQDSAETWFRYKKPESGKTTVQTSDDDDDDEVESRGVSSIEPGHEFTLQEHEATTMKRRRGILALLRIDAEDYGLDTYYDGPDDGRDEEWYWLWA